MKEDKRTDQLKQNHKRLLKELYILFFPREKTVFKFINPLIHQFSVNIGYKVSPRLEKLFVFDGIYNFNKI